MKSHHSKRRRWGNVLVFTTFAMVGMFGVLAFAVDLGYLHVIRTQLQSSADASALAAAWDLMDDPDGNGSPSYRTALASATAGQYAGLNPVGGSAPTLASQDVEVGYLADPSDPGAEMSFADPSRFNAVRVVTRRTAGQNGEIGLFFARVLGTSSSSLQAEATAAFLNNIGGFRAPADQNLAILPFALDKQTWDDLLAGIGADDWTWSEELGQVTPGPDGVLEVNLFPQGTGSPGNRGTVDIGSNNNSTADLARQITDGISAEDLEYHGGSLEFDANGELLLNGDTGISAGVKDELESVKGNPLVIPIFSQVEGNGNNAWYTIVEFVGVRILEVKLTGQMSSKRVIIQPARVETPGAIPATGEAQKSCYVYSPVWLVR